MYTHILWIPNCKKINSVLDLAQIRDLSQRLYSLNYYNQYYFFYSYHKKVFYKSYLLKQTIQTFEGKHGIKIPTCCTILLHFSVCYKASGKHSQKNTFAKFLFLKNIYRLEPCGFVKAGRDCIYLITQLETFVNQRQPITNKRHSKTIYTRNYLQQYLFLRIS